jgi:gamma-glutamylputrescine oxidase
MPADLRMIEHKPAGTQQGAGPHGNRREVPRGHVDSHYVATARELPLFPALSQEIRAEACVIGGGLAGLFCALELASAGVETVLLEASRIGWAASGRNGGFVSPGFAESIFAVEEKLGREHARELWRLSVLGVASIRSLIAESGRGGIIGGHGWLKLLRHRDVSVLERRAVRMERDYGAAYTFLSREGVARHVSSDAYHAGLLDMAPFHVQPLELAALVASRARLQGARLFENARVENLEREGAGWRVDTRQGRVRAREVVLATSAYGGPLASLNAAILPVSTYVVSAKSYHFDEAIRFGGCIADTRRAGDYYRLVGEREERRLIWGGRITTRRSVPASLGNALRRDILSVYPQLRDLKVERAWAGLMGYARHKMPVIGRLETGLWAATALGGHGLNTSAMAGRVIGEAIASGGDRWKLFSPYGPAWGGGIAGRAATQLEYWRLQALDRIDEAKS